MTDNTSSPLLFEGKTHLHLGENHTIGDVVEAIVDKLSASELYGFKLVLQTYIESDAYKQKEEFDKAFWAKQKEKLGLK